MTISIEKRKSIQKLFKIENNIHIVINIEFLIGNSHKYKK